MGVCYYIIAIPPIISVATILISFEGFETKLVKWVNNLHKYIFQDRPVQSTKEKQFQSVSSITYDLLQSS